MPRRASVLYPVSLTVDAPGKSLPVSAVFRPCESAGVGEMGVTAGQMAVYKIGKHVWTCVTCKSVTAVIRGLTVKIKA